VNNQNYLDYKNEIKKFLQHSNVQYSELINRACLTGNLSAAMKFVKTKWVMVIQEDLMFIESFDLEHMIEDMEKESIDYLATDCHGPNIHKNFYENIVCKPVDGSPDNTKYIGGLKVIPASGFTDNNHTASKEWYNRHVFAPIAGRKGFMEELVPCANNTSMYLTEKNSDVPFGWQNVIMENMHPRGCIF
jgi:hypothetical protein